jgi:hypothetical protein
MKFVSCSPKVCSLLLTVIFIALNSQFSQCQSTPRQISANLPLLFERNAGQTDSQVRYLVRSERYQLFLTDRAAVLKIAGKKQNAFVRNVLQNANENVRVVGLDQQPTKTNYLIGASSAWKSGVPNFGAVKYEGVYPGIDLKYYSRQRELEYDFDLAPGTNPSRISLKIEGAQKIKTAKDGSLVLKTAAG